MGGRGDARMLWRWQEQYCLRRGSPTRLPQPNYFSTTLLSLESSTLPFDWKRPTYTAATYTNRLLTKNVTWIFHNWQRRLLHRAIFAAGSFGVDRIVGLVVMALGDMAKTTRLHHRSWTIRIDGGIQFANEGIQDSGIRQAS